MFTLDHIISDRGSKYAVSGSPCADLDEARELIAQLKARSKKFAKATHHSWGLIAASGPLKDDDGESGAGNIILKILEREGLSNHLVVVTRWYGGKHLGGDRFRHVRDAVMAYLAETAGSAPMRSGL
ncbi:YigZ family protein [Novosphingobium terrae]|jgi:putative IMPACT (imprinted ancient) family translation regulator|uniref:YigZ family protein n=1 Tax=Novosphingobium terrae TaxID=2726189 RepID=UPI00198265D7|nr:YigZ family protein [Novosphingobium terrae]